MNSLLQNNGLSLKKKKINLLVINICNLVFLSIVGHCIESLPCCNYCVIIYLVQQRHSLTRESTVSFQVA